MKKHFITYIDTRFVSYLDKANINLNNAKNFFDTINLYDRDFLEKSEFYIKNKDLLDSKRGVGYWIWKPYIILEEFKQIDDGDVVFYLDAGDLIYNNISKFLEEKILDNNGYFLVKSNHQNKIWTKRECFLLMNCDNEFFHNQIQLEAGCCGFRKIPEVIDFLNEWLKWCLNKEVIDDNYRIENYVEFKDHRFDQSILTNLYLIKSLKVVSIYEILKFIRFNV